jgi:TolB-like protein/Flp pilus assembly protein TadD
MMERPTKAAERLFDPRGALNAHGNAPPRYTRNKGVGVTGLIERLRQRKLAQWAVAYAAAAFALLQGLDIVAQRFGWPESVERVAIVALAIGLFVALVLAWYHGERGTQRVAGTELMILALLLAIGGGLLWRVAQNPPAATATPASNAANPAGASRASDAAVAVSDKSIAVLPFDSLSDEKANGYFAVGIQDEILTRLAKIGALKVISRTSTAHYASTPGNLPEIARQLGVANILEGSVQKAGEAVHINVQLIRAASDEHLWAESYNRKLDDVFGVEGEVAQTIADKLRARLSGAEAAEITARPTSNAAAYDAYLRGLDFEKRTFGTEQLKAASKFYAQATKLDPEFALAWAHGSDIDGLIYFQAIDHSDERLQAARRGADMAMRLAPESAEAWLAKGSFLYHTKAFDGAGAAFAEAAKRMPNSPAILAAQAYLERRRGHYDRAIELMEGSLDRDPQNITILTSLGETLDAIGRHAAARVWYDRALTFRPGDPAVLIAKAGTWMSEGNLDAAGQLLEPLPLQLDDATLLGGQMNYLLYRRHFDVVIKGLTTAMAANDFVLDGWTSSYYPTLGWAQRRAGDEKAAQKTFAEGKRRLEALRTSWNDNGYLASNLALINAGLGDADAAEREAEHSVQLGGDDQYTVAGLLQSRAKAQALGGRTAHAREVEVKTPIPITVGDLRWSPNWDSLRDEPRFRQLLADGEAALKAQAPP